MAQAKGLVKLLKVKVGLVTSQKDELHGVLDKYVAKMTDEAKEAIEIEGHDVNRLREINSTIETVYEYLFHITSQMDDDTPTQIPSATGLSSTPPSASSSLQKSSSGSRQKKSRDTETDEMSKLHHRIEALESGFTACRNEMSQTTTQMTQAKDQLDIRCLRLEEKVQHLTNQNQETQMKQDVKFESMDKKIGDCQRQSQENDRRLRANLENHTQKLDDVVKKVEEISTQVNSHERSLVPVRVGFTAYCPGIKLVPIVGSRMTDFTDVLCNEGNHYNPSTGEFICPIDGLYLVSATLWQYDNGAVNTRIKRQSGNSATPATEVCRAYTIQTYTSSCGVGVVRLRVGDRVYVEVVHTSGTPKLNGISSFSCVLIT